MFAALSLDAQRDRPAAAPFAIESAPLYLFLAAAAALLPVLLAGTQLRLAVDEFGIVAGAFALLVWVAFCLRGRGFARTATGIEAIAGFSAICIMVTLITFALTAHPHPLADPWLAEADRLLLPGFDWPSAMLAFSKTALPSRIANAVYESLRWQPAALIVILSASARFSQVWHFLLSWIVTLCLVMIVFAFCPALGAYAHFGIAAADVPAMLDPTPWHQAQLVEAIRAGTLRTVNTGTLDGIVTFPSFHAGAAVLLARAYWNVRLLRWPFVALNALMLCSAVPIGGHYVIDLVAGAIVATIGIIAATHILDRLLRSLNAA